MADGTVIRDVREFVPMAQRNAASRLLFVQESFNKQTGRENLVAWRIKQIRARYVRRANRFAFATTQTIFDRVGNRADVARFKNQRLAAEQTKRWRVRIAQIAAGHQFALVKATFWIHLLLIALKWADLVIGQKFKLG